MILIYQFVLGFICSLIISFFSYLLHLLNKSGFLAATICGTLIIGFGPWYSIFIVGLFFISSAVLSLGKHLFFQKKLEVAAKGSRRDAYQVFANLVPGLFSLTGYYFFHQPFFLLGFVVSIAGATADTWASEIGSLNKKSPRNVLTGQKMVSGMSGGVSLLGFFASLLGSSLIIVFFGAVNQLTPLVLLSPKSTILLSLLGFLNSLIDSILGATFQGAYRCQVCLCPTEKRSHHQLPTIKTHGITLVTNDLVNFISTAITTSLTWFIFT